MELVELPNEMLQYVTKFLDAKSLASLNQTCKALCSISNIDTIWHALCQQDFNVCSNKGWNLTYKEIYTKILSQYPILGFHRLALQPYGGLVYAVWAEGEIKVNRIFPSYATTHDLVSEPAFSMTWSPDNESVKVVCVANPNNEEGAPATISKSQSYFVVKCDNTYCYKKHQRAGQTIGQSDRRLPEGFVDHPGVFKSFKLNKGYHCPLLPFEFGPTLPHFPFTPGLYKGDYGGHGVEIIQVRASNSTPERAEFFKITGDPNVPAGNVSVNVHLDKPVLLKEEDQMLMEEIIDADRQRPAESYKELSQTNDGNPDLRQPFVLPQNCYERDTDPPSTCLARYLGEGRISGHNFNNPSLCRVHVVKFNADMIGVLWLDLSCFMMMHRVKQSFSESQPF